MLEAGASAFADEFALEFRYAGEDVGEQSGCGVGVVGVDVLADGEEADPEVVEFLDPGDAVHERAAEAVHFPDQHGVKASQAGIVHEGIESGALGFGSGDLVGVGPVNFPAAAGAIFGEFANLNLVVLV